MNTYPVSNEANGSTNVVAAVRLGAIVAGASIATACMAPFSMDCETVLSVDGSTSIISTKNSPDHRVYASAFSSPISGVKLVVSNCANVSDTSFTTEQLQSISTDKTPRITCDIAKGTKLVFKPLRGPKSDPADPSSYSVHAYCYDENKKA